MAAAKVIDVHTHMLSEAWVAALQAHGGPRYAVRGVVGGQRAVHLDGARLQHVHEVELQLAAQRRSRDAV